MKDQKASLQSKIKCKEEEIAALFRMDRRSRFSTQAVPYSTEAAAVLHQHLHSPHQVTTAFSSPSVGYPQTTALPLAQRREDIPWEAATPSHHNSHDVLGATPTIGGLSPICLHHEDRSLSQERQEVCMGFGETRRLERKRKNLEEDDRCRSSRRVRFEPPQTTTANNHGDDKDVTSLYGVLDRIRNCRESVNERATALTSRLSNSLQLDSAVLLSSSVSAAHQSNERKPTKIRAPSKHLKKPRGRPGSYSSKGAQSCELKYAQVPSAAALSSTTVRCISSRCYFSERGAIEGIVLPAGNTLHFE